MQIHKLSFFLSVSDQLTPEVIAEVVRAGFRTVINNRPDNEAPNQPSSAQIAKAARDAGLVYRHMPVISGQIEDKEVDAFSQTLNEVPGPVLAFCRTGMRSVSLWALCEMNTVPAHWAIAAASDAGYDLTDLRSRLQARNPLKQATKQFDVVVIGGGAAGIAVTASLMRRNSDLNIAIVEPRDTHDYQPGFTMVGGGIFTQRATRRPMECVMPARVSWLKSAAIQFAPKQNEVMLADGQNLGYRMLILAPGLTLDWDGIPGLSDTLGRNGVTSNYRYDLAPYTWELVQSLRKGSALFTQPAMPIKCAGAPQKAMYLSCDAWRRRGFLSDINVEFHTVTPNLFGVADYVPALMEYVRAYHINLTFQSRLTAIDGDARTATFTNTNPAGSTTHVIQKFDMLHVTPPQKAPSFIATSPFANTAGWVDVDQGTLQQTSYSNVFSLGDACSAPNAKTAAAARRQAPVVAENVLAQLSGKPLPCRYDGYGSCPLTVERGKIVLAEFGYGGKLLPTFPRLAIDGKRPSRLAWMLKKSILPYIYWNGMLRGREWLARPGRVG